MTNGLCEDSGKKTIRSSSLDTTTCRRASEATGLSQSNTVYQMEYQATRYSGCYQDTTAGSAPGYKVHTNLEMAATAVPCSSSVKCDVYLCFDGPTCSVVDGSVANIASCACGTNVCTLSTGLYCVASLERCNTLPVCSNLDGTQVNQVSCACGESECIAGDACDEATSTCTTNVHLQTKFVNVFKGTCGQLSGGHRFNSKSNCLASLKSQGDGVAMSDGNIPQTFSGQSYNPPTPYYPNFYDHVCDSGQSDIPTGCSFSRYKLNFEPEWLEGRVCGDSYSSGKICLCMFRRPSCLFVDGTTPNLDSCSCGSSTCSKGGATGGGGLVCDIANSMCTAAPPCTHTDGSTPNTDVCTCTKSNTYFTECTSKSGFVCDTNHHNPSVTTALWEGCR